MPLYEYRCSECGQTWEEFRSMSSASDTSEAPLCYYTDNNRHAGKRVYSPVTIPNFTEDRLRLWKGPLGNGYSTALGQRMPETRKELERIAAEKGVEFVSPSAMPKEWQEAVDYSKHVNSGGERLEDPASFYDVSGFNAGDTRPAYMKEKVQK